MRSIETRIDSVRRLVGAARDLVGSGQAFREALVATSGLSPEGVSWALDHCLEWNATDDEIRTLVHRVTEAQAVHVILSANVFTAALRSIAVARAASERVVVRPSRREPVFAEALVRAANDPAITLAHSIVVDEIAEGEIHAYGRDETLAAIKRVARVPLRGHGSGMGIAWIENPKEPTCADALARDVIAFDQQGCLSPRVALVRGGADDAVAFAHALDATLKEWELRVPRGAFDDEAESRRYMDTVRFLGTVIDGRAHAVGVSEQIVIPPVGRHLHVVAFRDASHAQTLLAPWAHGVVAVGTDVPQRPPPLEHVRVSPLGRMQCPSLDGPVDLRLMAPTSLR